MKKSLSVLSIIFSFIFNAQAQHVTAPDGLTRCTPSDTELIRSICPGDTFHLGGYAYSQAGLYTDTFTAVGGCDSIITLSLGIYPVNFSFVRSICVDDTFYIGSHAYTQPGIYTDTLTSSAGCDSIVRVSLSIIPTDSTLITSICLGDTLFVGPYPHAQAGSYTDTIIGPGGCQRIVSTTLTINSLPVVTLSWEPMIVDTLFHIINVISPNDTTLLVNCGNELRNYLPLFGGHPLGGTYTGGAVQSDSISTHYVSDIDTVYYTYTDGHGCQATASDTVVVFACTTNAINRVNGNELFSIYPNPADDYVMIDFGPGYTGATLTVNDITARQLLQTRLNVSPQQLPTGNLPAGIYVVTLNENGQVGAKLLVKN